MVAAGTLREDLFHRLSVFVLRMPALRERPDDIPPLLDHFLAQAARELGREVSITQAAVEAARSNPWPGNIRALRNAIVRAAALADGPITASDLLGHQAEDVSAADEANDTRSGAIYVPRGDYAAMQHNMLRQVVAEVGSIRRAAHLLGIPRSTLGNWLRRGA
jgi:DNA-binding NtrC family response regulator